MLDGDHLALHLTEFGGRLLVATDEEGCWPEDDYRCRGCDTIFRSLAVLRSGERRRPGRYRLSFECELLKHHTHRKCKTCLQMHSRNPPLPSAEQIQRVTAALNAGKTIGQICWGRIGSERVGPHIVSFNKLKAYRAQNPDYDRFVCSVIASSNSRAMHRRHDAQLFHANVLHAERNDYHFVAGLMPPSLPPDIRDDVVQSIFIALLEGSLRRDQLKDHIRRFVTAHHREANKHGVGKYGLVSLAAPLFADGKALNDIETRIIWDEVPL